MQSIAKKATKKGMTCVDSAEEDNRKNVVKEDDERALVRGRGRGRTCMDVAANGGFGSSLLRGWGR